MQYLLHLTLAQATRGDKMDALLIIAIAVYFVRKTFIESAKSDVVDLPVGKNAKGYYDNTAFTQVYLMRRGERNAE